MRRRLTPGLALLRAAGFAALIIITFLHVTFGELIPKNIAIQAPDRTAIWLARCGARRRPS